MILSDFGEPTDGKYWVPAIIYITPGAMTIKIGVIIYEYDGTKKY